MPRIDPMQLLTCLNPLLGPNGGIKNSNEVIRLVNLMEKYSKKMVSKCIYIQILKCTNADLLEQFMKNGGWTLVSNWLLDGHNLTNWSFVQEILEMLLLCPVDGERLKSNQTPKIVKDISLKNIPNHGTVTLLAGQLVKQWLKIAHQEKMNQDQQSNNLSNQNVNQNKDLIVNSNGTNSVNDENAHKINNNNELSDNNNSSSVKSDKLVDSDSKNVEYKISSKESGLVLSLKRCNSTNNNDSSTDEKSKTEKSKSSSSTDKEKDKEKDRSKKSSSSSHKSSSSSSKSSHRDKDKHSSHKSSSSSSSSKDKDRHSSSKSGSSSSRSNSSRDKDKDREKEKERDKRKKESEKSQAEKDKETLSFLQPLPSAKLIKIPKRQHTSDSENKSSEQNGMESSSSKVAKTSEPVEKKKPSISIEVRKGDKPKTVKTLNSQFRNHGLAEEPPPPPSRKAIKKPATTIASPLPIIPSISTTFTSSVKSSNVSPPPTKKMHFEKAMESEVPERAGGVKLIKPKREYTETHFKNIFSLSFTQATIIC